MGKTLLYLSLVMFLFTASVHSIFAKSTEVVPATTTPTVSQTPQSLDSFELFWPLVAGKTRGDSLYSLKIFKENLRGALIFGKRQKASYQVFRGTKRVLEAEKLLGQNKTDLAVKTLNDALEEFKKAESNWVGKQVSQDDQEVETRLLNVSKVTSLMSESQKDEAKTKLDQISKLTKELFDKLH